MNWSLNEDLLKDRLIVEKGKDWLKFFLETNLNGEVKPNVVWDACQASMRGFFTQQNIIRGKHRKDLRNKLNKLLKEKEEELRKYPRSKTIQKEIKLLQKQLDVEMTQELEKRLKIVRQKNFEQANKTGKWLAFQLRRIREKKAINKIKKGKLVLTQQEDIKREFQSFYADLYKEKTVELDNLEKYIDTVKPQLTQEKWKSELNRLISIEEVQEAILNTKSGKAPGNDGLPISFYKTFIKEVAPLFNK